MGRVNKQLGLSLCRHRIKACPGGWGLKESPPGRISARFSEVWVLNSLFAQDSIRKSGRDWRFPLDVFFCQQRASS